MHIDLQNVGQRLEAVREALGLQKGGFAQSFGVDPSSYSKIIKGEKPLKADMAFMIAEKWGISMDYLYRGRLSDLPASVAEKLRKS